MNLISKKYKRFRGTAMAEFVLVIPLIVVIIALLFYFGRLMIEAQKTTVMVRYETWRDVDGAPRPGSDESNGNPQLNTLFFDNKALNITHIGTDGVFPEEPYEKFTLAANDISPDAAILADTWLYNPDDTHRNPRGRHEAFGVQGTDRQRARWEGATSISRKEIGNPEEESLLRRRHIRIADAWEYTHDWRASDDRWEDVGGNGRGHLRAVRDAFFMPFDEQLDAIDGTADRECCGGPEQPADSLAGLIRTLYVRSWGYRGPIVDPEQAADDSDSDPTAEDPASGNDAPQNARR
ncbi:MAG: hypothetical protein GC159_11295 [Phycisphaera sp.]|nr:hypothetical protein [Phycisphaera sp.]